MVSKKGEDGSLPIAFEDESHSKIEIPKTVSKQKGLS
jgi:hypothetical protein